MNNIARRLRRLEDEQGGDSRILVVFSGGATTQEVHDMLRRDHGITVSPRDELVHFATIYEDEDGNPDPNPAPPRYVPTREVGDFSRGRR
ncbi:hypothetical protein D3218_01730 [Aureimonas flava]|uniref:Uncharacterized protein n=1 Tax=Aureimonas flava TaxID=2320271 RepID=A0A3A1WR23_9HYPH|nr:hypothetical protein [Aureimonas flava]RIY03504.1 hypothetical protein D3218_01730 [Aureimonas flava]